MESYGEGVPFVTLKGMFHELKLKIENFTEVSLCVSFTHVGPQQDFMCLI